MKRAVMEIHWRGTARLAAFLIAFLAGFQPVYSAETVLPPVPAASRTASVLPPLPSVPKSPIVFFRQLLEASPTSRAELLSGKSPEHRRVLERNLAIYDNLPAAERELRLRALELRYYFNAVSRGPSTNRASRLAVVPELYRRAVADRLAYWDQLPEDLQKQVQGYEQLTRTLTPGAARAATVANAGLTTTVESNAVVWYSLPGPRRRQVQETFNRIFAMTAAEQGETVKEMTGKLSPAEREQMEKTLETFRKLPKTQRDRAIRGFQKFAGMSPEEQRQFFRSAQVWEKMSAEDREKWRTVVAKLPPMPPVPPGFGLPPMPPFPRPLPPAPYATNGR